MIPFCPTINYQSDGCHLRILPDTENALSFRRIEMNCNLHFHIITKVNAGD
jgi:hypothetical protein